MTRVKFIVARQGAGNGRVWWAAYNLTDVEIIGEGSGQSLRIKREASPHWLPKPAGKEEYMSRRYGTLVDGEAWIDLAPGTIISAFAEMRGGLRYASVHSPVLIVEDGQAWEGKAKDGTREVYVRIENARPLKLDEFETGVKGGY